MDIQESRSGRIIKSLGGYKAFVPHPLPPHFDWDTALVNSLSRADHILGKLSREGSMLPRPHILVRPFVTREAVLSSKIEGTQATIGEVLADAVGTSSGSPHELQEVHNYIRALDYALNRLRELPLSLRLIREIHGQLMRGARGEKHAMLGEFRRKQNWIGAPGCTVMTAKYVPPTPDELPDALASFEAFLYNRTLPPLVHIALCHYQFEAIHPFLDGNGRVGRLLITLLLIEHDLLSSPLLYLSAFFEATRSEYYQQLYSVSALGTWRDWLCYFLNGVAVQSLDALSRAERINNLIIQWHAQVGRSSLPTRNAITYLAVNPFLTVKKIAQDCAIAFTTAQRVIQTLESLGIVAQVSGNKRDRVYCATDILAILEEAAKINEDPLTM
jgi:Fic family protein